MCTEISYTGIFQSALCNVYCMFNLFAVCISYSVRLKPLLPLLHTALNNCSVFCTIHSTARETSLNVCSVLFAALFSVVTLSSRVSLCNDSSYGVLCSFFSSGEQVDFALNVCFSFLSSDSDVVV